MSDRPLVEKWLGGWSGLTVVVIGLVLVLLSVPRIVAYGRIVEKTDLADFWIVRDAYEDQDSRLSSLRSATTWLSADSDLQMRLGQQMLSAGNATHEASIVFAGAVADAPNRPVLWCLLAQAHDAEGAATDTIVPIIRLSYLVGPRSGACAIPRMAIVTARWNEMPDDLQLQANNEILMLWQTSAFRGRLVDRYLTMDFRQRAIVRRAVFAGANDAKAFDKLLLTIVRSMRESVEKSKVAN